MGRFRLSLVLSALALVAAGVLVGRVIAQSGDSTVVRTPLDRRAPLDRPPGRQ